MIQYASELCINTVITNFAYLLFTIQKSDKDLENLPMLWIISLNFIRLCKYQVTFIPQNHCYFNFDKVNITFY
jgi:hypothetical protein